MTTDIKRNGLIGVDIGSSRLRVAQADGSGGVQCAAAQRHNRDRFTRTDAQAVRDLITRAGLNGNRVAVAAFDPDLTATRVELPPSGSGAPIGRLALQAAAELGGHRPHELEHAWWTLPTPTRSGPGQTAMVAAVPTKASSEMIDLLGRAGLDVEAIDVRMLAIARGVVGLAPAERGLDVVVDLGWLAARVVVCCDGVPVYEHVTTDGGARAAVASLVEEGAVPEVLANAVFSGRHDDACLAMTRDHARGRLVQHACKGVETALKYAKHVYSDRVVRSHRVVGGSAAVPGVGDVLLNQLGRDEAAQRDVGPASIPAGYEQAAGLALWGVAA